MLLPTSTWLRRTIGLAGLSSLMLAAMVALPGCGGGSQENPDGTTKVIPGTVTGDQEKPVPPPK